MEHRLMHLGLTFLFDNLTTIVINAVKAADDNPGSDVTIIAFPVADEDKLSFSPTGRGV